MRAYRRQAIDTAIRRERLLALMADGRWIHTVDLARKTPWAVLTVRHNLTRLKAAGMVESKRIGGASLWRLA